MHLSMLYKKTPLGEDVRLVTCIEHFLIAKPPGLIYYMSAYGN